jgi:hypothetical protein
VVFRPGKEINNIDPKITKNSPNEIKFSYGQETIKTG